MRRLSRKGFTLVELMIVVAIITLLATIAIPNLIRARMIANEAACQATLKSIAAAAESYSVVEGVYPAAVANFTGSGKDFPYDFTANNPKSGYNYSATDGTHLTEGGYTVTATRDSANTGSANYRVKTGGLLETEVTPGSGTWTLKL